MAVAFPGVVLRSGDRKLCLSNDGVGDARAEEDVGGVLGRDDDPRDLSLLGRSIKSVGSYEQRVKL